MTNKPTAGRILDEVGSSRRGRESATIAKLISIGTLESLERIAKLQEIKESALPKKLVGGGGRCPFICRMISVRLPVVIMGGTLSNARLHWVLLTKEGLASRVFVGTSLLT